MKIEEAVEIRAKYVRELNDAKAELVELEKQYRAPNFTAKDVDELSGKRIEIETRRDIALAKIRQIDVVLDQLKAAKEKSALKPDQPFELTKTRDGQVLLRKAEP